MLRDTPNLMSSWDTGRRDDGKDEHAFSKASRFYCAAWCLAAFQDAVITVIAIIGPALHKRAEQC